MTDKNGLESNQGKLDVAINVPPTTGDASKTINPNQTATLTPEATPGTGEIVSAAFDNGSTTKDVPGEGTWTISVKDGQPVAVFTPVEDYDGKVTAQPYTVTDKNGLESNHGKLNVNITKLAPKPSTTPSHPASTPSITSPGKLPVTGAEGLAGLTAGALVLLALGGAAVMVARKRRSA